MLEIVELNDSIEKAFWAYVLRDIPRYFFFILDLKIYPERCKFFIALDDEIIVGLCLIWRNHIIQMRSDNPEVVKALFDAIPKDLPIDEITFEYKHRDLLFSLVPNPKMKISNHRMILQKEKMISRFPLNKPFTQRNLTFDDVEQIEKLMRVADPYYWGDFTGSRLEFGEKQVYTGLFDGNKLISYTLAWIDETAAILSTVATHPKYQNQGLATYLVNEGVHLLMKNSEIGLIHVRTDNPPAIKVYSKCGYEVYSTHQNVRLR